MTSTEGVALVTGGAGGIGAAVCLELAAAGRRVAVADLAQSEADAVAADLPGDGHLGVAFDVADTEAVAAACARVDADLGPIDTLVNVAGWDRFVPFVETTPEFWDRVIDINYRGTLNTVHAVLPGMIEREHGRIVSVASDAARVGSSLESIYAGAKGAVISFSKSVAREVAKHQITVNVVCPGPTDTPLIRGMAAKLDRGDRIDRSADPRHSASVGWPRPSRHRPRRRLLRLGRGGVRDRPDAVGQRRPHDALTRTPTDTRYRHPATTPTPTSTPRWRTPWIST